MAKKILGDDPFRSSTGDAGRPPRGKPTPAREKSKRAPSRKTEAPKAARATSQTKATKAVKSKEVAAATSVSPADVVPVPDTVAIAPRAADSDPPLDAAPGSWRWWRYRQLQLARTEDATHLARGAQGGSRLDRFGRDEVLAGRAEPIIDVVYRSLLRVSVRGLGHVPETGRAILVARRRRAHLGGLGGAALARLGREGLPLSLTTPLDAAIIGHAIRTEHVAHREVRPLVRAARLYTPVFGALLRRLGGVPADVHDLARLLDDERLALAFVDEAPAGGGAPAGPCDPKTLICLALVTGAPIIPVVVAGGIPGRFFGGDGLTAIAFGTPLYHAAEFGADGAEDEALVARLAQELLAQLAPS